MTETVPAEEALVYAMVTMCVADRDMATIELKWIEALIDHLPVFAGFDTARIPAIADRTAAFLQRADGIDEILELVKASLPEKLRETCYALAVEVAAADVDAVQEELRFLELMRDAFDLPQLATAAIEHSARVRYRRA